MGKLSEKQLMIVTVVVAIVLTGVFTTLIYMDFRKIDEEKGRIETADQNIRKAQSEIDRMRDRERDVIIYREIVERDAKVLPDEEEINEFWRTIKEFKEISGVQIDRIDGLPDRRAKGKASAEAITPIQIRLTVRADVGQLLKFVNLFENYDRLVSITSLSVGAGEPVDVTVADQRIRHDVSIQLRTYVYNPRGGSVSQVEIPNYDKRKLDEEIQRGIRKNITPNKEVYQLRPSLERRDPFVSPRKPPETTGENGKTLQQIYEEQKNLLDRLVLQLQFIQQDVEIEAELLKLHKYVLVPRVKRQLDERIKSLELEITKVRQQRMITVDELLDEFEASVVAPFRKIQSERVTQDVPVRVSLREVRECLESMRAAFDKTEYAKVMDTYQAYKIYREGRELADEAKRMEEEIIEMARRATVVSDFESRDIKISALIVGRDRSVALINGKSVTEGDPIEAGSKILLQEVNPDGCTFLYEGVQIRRTTQKTAR